MELKMCITLATFISIGCFVTQTDAIKEDNILEFIEEMRNRMCHPLFGLPALDPLQINHANFSLDNKYIVDFNCAITDFQLSGLSNFNVTKLKISTIPFRRSSFNITLPFTTVKSLYVAKGSLAHIVFLNGNDKAEAQVENIEVSISWVFKTSLTVGIRDLRIEISVGNLLVDIKNITEEDRLNDFLNALINEMGIELLNDLWLEAKDRGVILYIENTVNKLLGKYSLSDIIKILSGISGGEGPPFEGVPADCNKK